MKNSKKTTESKREITTVKQAIKAIRKAYAEISAS
jgi:hypothetical protein